MKMYSTMCKERYKLKSRYNCTKTTLEKKEDKKYVALSNSYVRVIYEHTEENKPLKECNIEAIDFDGGPMIWVGHQIPDCKELGKIKSISGAEKGFVIEFE